MLREDVRMKDNKRKYGAIEIEIAKKLIERGYEWLAEDSDETLYAYDDRPEKGNTVWMPSSDRRPLPLLYGPARGVIPIFESVRWEDEEPVNLRGIVRQDTETAGLRHCNTVPPDTVSDFCNVTKITVETDEEKPVQIAMIESGKISVAGGYRVRLTPRYR